jgi:hypothetical protein
VSARRIELAAPAKVNLTLAVLGRRSDGYHEIDSVMMGLALADRLAVEERDQAGVTLAVHGPAAGGVPADGSNLAVRAAEAVRALARDGFKLGVAEIEGEEDPGLAVTHSDRFVLVDSQGRVRGYYDPFDPEGIARLERDLAALDD